MRDHYLIQANLARTSGEASQFLSRQQPSFDSIGEDFSKHVDSIWIEAKRLGVDSGSLFEMLVGSIFMAADLTPFYSSAELMEASGLEMDYLIWNSACDAPVCFQLTSTLRERFKLADLQAFKVKTRYPSAEFHLLTMDSKDVARRKSTTFESLDSLIYCGDTSFDQLLKEVKSKVAPSLVENRLLDTKGLTLHVGSASSS